MTKLTERPSLTPVQMTILAFMGALFWFVAALVVRWTAADWAGQSGPTALMFALIVAVTIPVLFIGAKTAGVGRENMARSATVMVGMAALLDGLALTWFRTLYGTDPATVLAGSAAILWGAGVALVLGMWFQRAA